MNPAMTVRAALLAVFCCIHPVAGFAAKPAPLKHCKASPEVVEACFTFRGRMQAWNGSPVLRISRIGTQRILGVIDEDWKGYWRLPANVREFGYFGYTVTADFEYCPFTRDRRATCASDAWNQRETSRCAPRRRSRRVPDRERRPGVPERRPRDSRGRGTRRIKWRGPPMPRISKTLSTRPT